MSDLNDYNNTNFYENQNSEFKTGRAKNKKGVLFVLSIVFFTLSFLLSCLKALIDFLRESQINKAYAMGYAAGTIIISMVIIVILLLLSTRVFKKKVFMLIFSIIFLLVSFLSTADAMETSLKEIKMTKAAEDKIISMFTNMANGKDISEENFDKSVYGNMTPILYVLKDFGVNSYKLSTDISKDIDALDFENMLTANTLGSTEKINNAKKNIDESIKIYDKYEIEYNNLITNLNKSISELELPKSFKKGFLEGFTQAQEENGSKLSNLFKVEKDVSNKVNSILNFMLSIKGKYTVENDRILFETNDDLNKYNGYIEDIQKLAQEETNIKNDLRDSLKLKLDKINTYR